MFNRHFCQLPASLLPGHRRGHSQVLACWARRWDQLRTWGLAGVPSEMLESLKTGHGRNMLQEAWFNLITLQDPDYLGGFSCCCGQYVIADGLQLGFKLRHAYFGAPLAAGR